MHGGYTTEDGVHDTSTPRVTRRLPHLGAEEAVAMGFAGRQPQPVLQNDLPLHPNGNLHQLWGRQGGRAMDNEEGGGHNKW